MSIWSSLVFALLAQSVVESESARPDPVKNPESRVMLAGPWVPANTHDIDYARLPRVKSDHAMIADVRAEPIPRTTLDHKRGGMSQHGYLTHYDGRYWAMWSEGPGIEDKVGQRVKYATSPDGLKWTAGEWLSPEPPNSGPGTPHYATRTLKGFRYIARGFWQRDGELLALASLDEAAGFFGPSLELRAFRWSKNDKAWQDAGVVYKNAINNFPPLKLRTGNWMMSRRTFDYRTTNVHFLVGGVKALDQWESFPVFGTNDALKAEEPDWWILPGDHLSAVFRDNQEGHFLYRSFSSDDGRTWSKPVQTNFSDATSKISGLRLRDGRYLLASNPSPNRRDPLALSVSDDGLVFTKMVYLTGDRIVDYPHVFEHGEYVFVAFNNGKQTIELVRIKLSDLDAVEMPTTPLVRTAQSER